MLCRGLSSDIKKILITACNDISCAAISAESMKFVTYTAKIVTIDNKKCSLYAISEPWNSIDVIVTDRTIASPKIAVSVIVSSLKVNET